MLAAAECKFVVTVLRTHDTLRFEETLPDEVRAARAAIRRRQEEMTMALGPRAAATEARAEWLYGYVRSLGREGG